MIRDDAERLCVRLRERFGDGPPAGLTAEVIASEERIEFAAPGGARPRIIRYKIRVAAGDPEVTVGIDVCEELLERALPDWSVAEFFAELVKSAG